jgi:hypothetical protein
MLDQILRTSRHGAPRRVAHTLASCSLVWWVSAATSRHVTPRHVTSRRFTLRHAMARHATPRTSLRSSCSADATPLLVRRIHHTPFVRYGQLNKVTIYRLLAGNVDLTTYNKQVDKQQLFMTVVDKQNPERHFTDTNFAQWDVPLSVN